MMTSVMIWRSRYQSAGSLKIRIASMGLFEEPYPRFLMGHTPGAAAGCSVHGGPRSEKGCTHILFLTILAGLERLTKLMQQGVYHLKI